MTSGSNYQHYPQQPPYPQQPQQQWPQQQWQQQPSQPQQQWQQQAEPQQQWPQQPQWQQSPPPPPPPQPSPPRRKTGLWIFLGVLAVVLTVGVGAVVGGVLNSRKQSDSPFAEETAPADPDSVVVTEKDLEALLADHTKALNSGDVKAYTKIFDQKNTALVQQQSRTFANLHKLPLTAVSYQARQQQGRAHDSFGRGVKFTFDVAFVHQFKGLDLAPVSEWYRWTVTKASVKAPIVITKVEGAPAPVGESKTLYYPGPWDIWPDISVVSTDHSIVLAHPKLAARAKQVAPIAEQAAVNDLTFWKKNGGKTDAIPNGFVVALVEGQTQLGNMFRKSKANEAGVSIGLFAVPSVNDLNSQKLEIGGTRVVMDTTSPFFRTAEGTVEIFRHEFAHSTVASFDALKGDLLSGLDKWVVEGFAEYVANRGHPISTNVRFREGQAFVQGRLPAKFQRKLPENIYWDLQGMTSVNYLLGHLANRYIAERYGEPKLVEFITATYQGGKSEEALRKVLGTDAESFQRQWAAYVQQQLG
ncbi:hypothetical protein [Streptosporangium sp. NPDC000396]|uniref:hypothetical protein n=1 Tax=Streptosporangium sp. NPDC000396 TaxID=3366185 RepID=UPI0036815F3E